MPTAATSILDYKTGAARTEKQVRTGLAPQLTLEAAMLRQGKFRDIPAGASVAELGYVLLQRRRAARRAEAAEIQGRHAGQSRRSRLEKLTALAKRFADADQPYRSLVHPMWTTHYGDYDDLARERQGMVEHRRRDRRRPEAANETARRHSEFGAAVAGARSPRRTSRHGSPPMPDSGKTHVLVQRVINLLLDGVEPEKILCITFTKAAAANMAKRVFDTLAEWTTLDDTGLDKAIRERSSLKPDAARRAVARRLFARALDTRAG